MKSRFQSDETVNYLAHRDLFFWASERIYDKQISRGDAHVCRWLCFLGGEKRGRPGDTKVIRVCTFKVDITLALHLLSNMSTWSSPQPSVERLHFSLLSHADNPLMLFFPNFPHTSRQLWSK